MQPDGKILIVGDFTNYQGSGRVGVARLNADGSVDTSFDPGSGLFPSPGYLGAAQSVVLQPDGKAVIAGGFGGINGVPCVHILRLGGDDFAAPPPFFAGSVALSDQVDYLAFPGNGNVFGYYSFLTDPNYLYHFDLGYEYVFDASDGEAGVYLYDFASGSFFYTSPNFSWPYLYDFSLNALLYYYPDPSRPDHYNTNGVRCFYNFSNGQIITK